MTSKDGTRIAYDRLGAVGSVADAIVAAVPRAERHTIEGQTHAVDAEALAPVLARFLACIH